MKRRTPSLTSALACWLLFGLAGRIFVPAGFMVTPGAGSWPVVPCPGASSGSLPETAHGSHAADAGHSEDRGEHPDGESGSACPLGAFFALAAEIDAVDTAPLHLPESRLDVPPDKSSAVDRAPASPRPRGPPSPLSIFA